MLQPTHFINIWVFFINIVSFCCMLAGAVGSEWYIFVDNRNPRNPVELTFGLWRHCRITLSDQGDGCFGYDDSSGHEWMKNVQAFVVVSSTLTGINLLVIVAAFRKQKLATLSIAKNLIAGKF